MSSGHRSVTFTGVPTGGWFGEGAVLVEIRKHAVMALRRSTIAFPASRDFSVAAGYQPAVHALPAHAAERAARAVHRRGRIRAPARHRSCA
ncbi:hypothetical protein ACTMU2_12705 [Cupriavidus basilensis]